MKRWHGGALWLVLSLVWWPGLSAQAGQSAAAASCQIGCEQALAQCEKSQGHKGHCPRRHGQCLQQCSSPGKDKRSTAQKKLAKCEQSCDLYRSSCEQANPGNIESCVAGRQSCVQRCR